MIYGLIIYFGKLGLTKSNLFEDYKLSPKKSQAKKLHIDELIRIKQQVVKVLVCDGSNWKVAFPDASLPK